MKHQQLPEVAHGTDWMAAVDELAAEAKAPARVREVRVHFKLMAPLVHGSFGPSAGNTTLIRRLAIVGHKGMMQVPVVSGNGLRGPLRRIVMEELCERAGLGVGQLPGHQWDRLYAVLGNGGTLEGSEQTYKPEAVRALRESLPPLSVFGSAIYSWMLPGRLEVGFSWPICQETVAAGLVNAGDITLLQVEDLIGEVSQARLPDGTVQDTEVTGVKPMPTTMETLATGAVLATSIAFPHATEIERGCIMRALQHVRTLGGKGGAGFGRVAVELVSGEDQPAVDAYDEWLRTAPLRESLTALAVQLEGSKAKKKTGKKRAAPKAEPVVPEVIG